MKYLIIFIFLISCKKENSEILKGDLTFKSISFMSLYGASDKVYNDFLSDMNRKIKNNEFETKDEKKLYNYFKVLEDLDLLRKPCVFLNTKDDTVVPIYISEIEYLKLKDHNHISLIRENKKIKLELKIKKSKDSIYFSDKIISIKKVNGLSRSNINGQ